MFRTKKYAHYRKHLTRGFLAYLAYEDSSSRARPLPRAILLSWPSTQPDQGLSSDVPRTPANFEYYMAAHEATQMLTDSSAGAQHSPSRQASGDTSPLPRSRGDCWSDPGGDSGRPQTPPVLPLKWIDPGRRRPPSFTGSGQSLHSTPMSVLVEMLRLPTYDRPPDQGRPLSSPRCGAAQWRRHTGNNARRTNAGTDIRRTPTPSGVSAHKAAEDQGLPSPV
jgi:hypothetical protein